MYAYYLIKKEYAKRISEKLPFRVVFQSKRLAKKQIPEKTHS